MHATSSRKSPRRILMRSRTVGSILPALLLGGCMVSHGKCDIPGTEREIRRSIKVGLLSRDFQSHGIQVSAEAYLNANPDCCQVAAVNVSWPSWIMWDRYSLPLYRVETLLGFEADGTTATYHSFGLADRCGRVADPYGEGDIVAGPVVDTFSLHQPKVVSLAVVRARQQSENENAFH